MNRLTHVLLVGLFLACATSARSESVEWVRQLGTTSNDESNGVSADGLGNVYISGFTDGDLGGPNAGGPNARRDVFVAKIADGVVPEPSSLALSMVGMLGLFVGARRQR